MMRLQHVLVGEEELGKLKRKILYSVAKSFETPQGNVKGMKTQIQLKISPTEYLQKIGDVSAQEVLAMARDIFPKDQDDPKYVTLLRSPLIKE